MKLFLVCLLAVGHVAFAKTFSKNIPLTLCRRSDPELNTCLLEIASPALKILKNGIPEWNLQPLDPLNVEFMTAEGDFEVVKVKMVMKNITLYGFSDTIGQKVKFDPLSLTGELTYHIPVIRMTCDYFATGRLFVIPLESSAHFDGNFTDIDVTLAFRLNTVQRKNKEYFTIEKITAKSRIDKAHVQITSIDPAQQPQVNVIQDFFNENDRLVLDATNQLSNSHTGEFIKQIAESYIRRFPADELLPL